MTSKAARRRFKKAERLRAFRGTQRNRRPKQRGEKVRTALAALVGTVFGVVLTGYAGLMLAGAVGLSGTSDYLHVDSCAVVRPDHNKPVTQCRGQLLSPGGRLIDPDAVIQADARIGSTIAVRDQPLVGLETLGFRAVSGWATLTVTGLLVLALGMIAGFTLCGSSLASETGARTLLVLTGVIAVGGLAYGLAVLYEHVFQ
ncbi:hypothetical protein OHT57_04330 [Streptomyces sp. NBC_00285]|uniref:hypothetical protein n=1 Tax=Streptomyces sp. NBC_00285 TaxID=2975700 RepID=UPI002E2D0D91|nr:hypothetical protein [Streptomyces sp. NBC_00285]